MPSGEAPARSRMGAVAERPSSARRTVVIRGQVAPPPGVGQTAPSPTTLRALGAPRSGRAPHAHRARRRPPRRPSERIVGARPDRAALWAVLMGLFLIAVAVLSASGA